MSGNSREESWLTGGCGLFLSMLVVGPLVILALAYLREIFLGIATIVLLISVIYLIRLLIRKS